MSEFYRTQEVFVNEQENRIVQLLFYPQKGVLMVKSDE